MMEWRAFDESLRSEARFFSKGAEQHLASIFNQLEELETRDGRSVILNAGPDTELTHIFRARVFQDESSLKSALMRPDKHLGPPPTRLATAGRMNARGISVFYGANSAGVGLAEVRPPVGSRVAVARFNFIRPVKLLDLTALDGVIARGSIFDPSYTGRLERSAFLRTLSDRLARPVMPEDEAFSYLATQAVADYLSTDQERNLDGILYASVQAGGDAHNVVLFRKSARVKYLDFPDGTKISADIYSFDEDEGPDYSVTEQTLSEQADQEKNRPEALLLESSGLNDFFAEPSDSRALTLSVDTTSIAVHHIEAINIKSSSFQVRRHRREKHEPMF